MMRQTTALILLVLSMPSQAQNTPLSPCPSVFEYQEPGSEQGRWDGIMHLSTDVPLYSLFLNIELDNKAEILVNWIGEVSTQNNKDFRIESTESVIMPGSPLDVKFYVKFNTLKDAPLLRKIKLNGKELCNADIPLPVTGRATFVPPAVTEPIITEATSSPSWYTNAPPPSHIIPEGSLETNPIGNSNKPNVDVEQRPVFEKGTNEALPARIDGGFNEITKKNPVASTPSFDKQIQCGVVVAGTSLIVNGTSTAEGEWPWQVALYHTQFADNKFICGGTLVSNLHVITAAHCVTLKDDRRIGNIATYSVYLGKYNLMTSIRGVRFRYLSKIIIHEEYEPSALRRDIAILQMQEPVSYSSWIQPACLWPENSIGITNVIGKAGTVVGWGFDGNTETSLGLRKVKMPVIDEATCLRSFPSFFERFISESTYCAGYANGSSACNGDSGGGMVFRLGGSWYLRGVVSLAVVRREDQICDSSHFIIFTDVAQFLPWIKGIIYGV